MLLNRIKILLILFLPAFIWGVMFLISNQVLHEINPLYLSILRYSPSIIVIIILLYFIEGKEAFKINKDFLIVAGIGAISMFGFNVLVWIGVSLSTGVLASILLPMMPLFGVLISFIFFKQKYNILTFVIIFLAFFGVFLASSKGDLSFLASSDSLGFILIFLGVFVATFAGILSQRFKDFSVLKYTVVTNCAGVLVFVLFAILGYFTHIIPLPSWDNLSHVKWEVAYIMIFTGAFPMLLAFKGFKIIGVVNGMLLNNLVPLITIIGSLILGYVVGIYEFLGALIIIGAMFLHGLNIKSMSRKSQ